jgi:hypothetical protein
MTERLEDIDEMDEGFFDELEEEAEEKKIFGDEHEQ